MNGCASSSSGNLTPILDTPKNYIYFFNKSKLKLEKNSMPLPLREKSYKAQLTAQLHRDSRLKDCVVVLGSVSWIGRARVVCGAPLPLEAGGGDYYENGESVKRYWIKPDE